MRIAVMGAGAVGAFYGGMLARAGHAVTLIGRARHVDAVRARGLRLQTAQFDEHVAMAARTDAAAVEGADLVLFCVKSTDTEAAGAAIAPHLAPGAVVLTLQNGVDNAERLAALLPAHAVLAAVVYVATEMAGDGHVRHHGRGELVIAASPASERIASLFSAAGMPTQAAADVRGALWAKLILNCAYNALSAATGLPYGELVLQPGVNAVLRDVMDECLAVACADGVAVPGDTWREIERIAETMPTQHSSTAQDLALHRRSEIDHLNGYVVRRGDALGIATPANRVLWTMVKALELSARRSP